MNCDNQCEHLVQFAPIATKNATFTKDKRHQPIPGRLNINNFINPEKIKK
jgi:hypothetical protein